jgi:hypothetical protein
LSRALSIVDEESIRRSRRTQITRREEDTVMNAYIFAQFAGGDFSETMSEIRGVEGVKQAHLLMGPTDIVAFVEAADLEALGEVALAILELDGVARTDTRLAWPV